MKPGWEVRPLGEVARIVNGGTPKSSISAYWNGDVPWMTPKEMGALNGASVSDTTRTISEEGLENSSARLVPRGSVILSTRAPIGYLAINEVPMAFNQGCRGLIPHSDLDTHYLRHFLDHSRQTLQGLGTGATFAELAAGVLKGFAIPLPPLEEQRRIVAVLDEAFEGLARARANIKANLADAEEVAHRAAGEQFRSLNAPEHPLDDLTVPNAKITYGVVKPGPKGDIPFVRGGDLRDGQIAVGELRTITEEVSNQYQRTKLKGGEVLVCLVGQPGQTGVVPPELKGANIARQTALLRFTDEIDPHFASDFLLSDEGQKRLGAYTVGSVQQVINLGDLQTVQMPVPSIETQRAIVERCAELRATKVALRETYTAQLADLDALRQSLLARAFRGELT